jgi:hypothetical protein
MITNFFDTAKTNEFADWIVAEMKRALPPDPDSMSHKKKHAIRARQFDESVARRVVEFTHSTVLNFYTKARLVARVREGMNAYGYQKAFVDAFAFELIERIQASKNSIK